jgi:hypothetical protein
MKYSHRYAVHPLSLVTVTTGCFSSCWILGKPRVFVVGGGGHTGLLLIVERDDYKFKKYKRVFILVNIYGVDKFLFLLTSENQLHWSQNSRVRAARHLNPRTVYSLSPSLSLYIHVTALHRNRFPFNNQPDALCPSSGVLQFHLDSAWKRSSKTCMKITSAECTVKNSWWWAKKMPETCRVL